MKTISKYLLLVLFLVTSVYAEERIETGSRELPEEIKQEIQQQVKQEQSEKKSTKKTKNSQYYYDANQVLYRPYDCHTVIGGSIFGDTVIIEDESVWDVRSGYESEALRWNSQDKIIIVKNDAWFTWYHKYDYRMINLDLNTSIEVQMAIGLGPKLNNPNTLLVDGFSANGKEIILSDRSRWRIYSSDNYITNNWLDDDGIIVGTNVDASWLYSEPNNILINVNIANNPCVRAEKVN